VKVLLFVQTGDARPKCVKSFGNRKRNALAYFDAIAKRFGGEGQPERAWLVECENAEDGRTVIVQERVLPAGIVSTLGRILASSSNGRGESCPSNVVNE